MLIPDAPGAPVTSLVHCAKCVGPVTLQVLDWPAPTIEGVGRGWWKCPYCADWNLAHAPGRLVWATKGHDYGRTV